MEDDFFLNDEGRYPVHCELPVRDKGDRCVLNRLGNRLSYWRDSLLAPRSVLDVLESGYKLPFVKEPAPFAATNSASAFRHAQFVDAEVERLLANGVIASVAVRPSGRAATGGSGRYGTHCVYDVGPRRGSTTHDAFAVRYARWRCGRLGWDGAMD